MINKFVSNLYVKKIAILAKWVKRADELVKQG